MCDKPVDTFQYVFDSVSDQYMSQELCDKIVFEESFMSKYCHKI